MTSSSDRLSERFAADQTMLHDLADGGQCNRVDGSSAASSTAHTGISVNGVEIKEAEILAEMQHHPATTGSGAMHAAAEALVVRQLLLQRAGLLGLEPEPIEDRGGQRETREEAMVRALIDKELEAPVATESECLRYYQNHPHKFASAPLYEVRHILLAVAPDDSEQRGLKQLQAQQLIARLQQHPDEFVEAAKAFSDCPSKEVNGSLGQITRGATVKEFEAALETMEQDTISPAPVESRFGFHIIALDKKVAGAPLPFSVVKEKISAWLGAVSWSRAVSQYVRMLAGNAAITGIELDQADGPLVQ